MTIAPPPPPGPHYPPPVPMLLPLLLACQDPFPEDRHDLASFRIAAVQARSVQDGLAVRAFVYSGLGMWHATVPEVTWSAGDQQATGPTATLAVAAPVEIALTASDGVSTESAVLALEAAPTPPTVESWSRGVVDLTIDDVVTPIDERRALSTGEDQPVEPGGALRYALTLREADVTTHWMSTGGDFAELDAASTDWFAGTAVLDNNEIQSTSTLAAGVQSVVALSFDGRGGNSWITLDAPVALLGSRLLTGGRVFPVEAEPAEGLFAATLQAADTAAGVALVDVSPVDDASSAEAVCGQAAASVFDFAALAEGWCARDEVVGARIVVDGQVVR